MSLGHREDRQWETFILPLSYHDSGPQRGQTVRYIHFSTELSWLWATERTDSEIHSFSLWAIMTRAMERTVRFIHSPTELSWPRPRREQSVRYIHLSTELSWLWATERTDSARHSFYHWAIMTRATERTDSEIHSFSHWAIMTPAMERADSEIHSFSHWAIMTRATERTDSEIHSFYHRAIITPATERTDSVIYSFSHWAIMTPTMERTDSEIHSFSGLLDSVQSNITRSIKNKIPWLYVHPLTWCGFRSLISQI